MFQVGPLVEAEGTQPILPRTGHHQSPEWFGTNPIPYSRAVALPKPSPNPSDPLVAREETVIYYLPERLRAAIEASGATFRVYQSRFSEVGSFASGKAISAMLRGEPPVDSGSRP